MWVPGTPRGQAWVVIVPVVVVVVRADEVAMPGLLVVSEQVFVREPLGGQTDTVVMLPIRGHRLAVGRDRSCPPQASVPLPEGTLHGWAASVAEWALGATRCSSPSNPPPGLAAVSALRERPPAYATPRHPQNELGGHVNLKVRTPR